MRFLAPGPREKTISTFGADFQLVRLSNLGEVGLAFSGKLNEYSWKLVGLEC